MSYQQHQQLLETLHACMAACNHCYDACLKEENVKMMAPCIRLDRECADICHYLESAITRNSPFVSQLASVCAEICTACGEECKKHEYDHCQKCVDACFQCAEACKSIA
ncbi:four-helix bundle copper-binding protein [Gracilibacillus caseinilyticus]|uniref:Four-helix bundle copper-binding protein n=1 Tax=Gracilibacillus caseinilyticus TaxID=2932256 RepID=A0ABY4EY15_9BACI|nr:four-helix bundle copper-binding protein [Gracilibacillus caseinilyticus]UOQ49296.1 four-helix bundle copper-binding protein [Gracilibacillus caseinilyticus]